MTTPLAASVHDPSSPGLTGVDPGGHELLWVDPRELIIADNVRVDVALTREFIADIAERGVRQVIPVRRDESGRLVVRTGQRRVLAAIEAGLLRVRVHVEPEALTDAREQGIDRILDQLAENEHRSSLSDADEVRATQQLLGLGLSARQIARRRHIPAQRVTTAAAVARNPVALDALGAGVLDLTQAAVVAEFAEDDTAVAALKDAAAQRPEQFDHLAQRLRDTREETRRREELTATLTEQGVRIIDRPADLFGGTARPLSELRASPDTEPGTELTAAGHAGCPGHAAFLSERSYGPVAERIRPVWVCTDFQAHGHAERHTALGVTTTGRVAGPMTDEQKAERREVIANNKAWEAATTVRRTWLRTFFARQAAPRDAARWITTTLAWGGPQVRKAMEFAHPLAVELLGLQPSRRVYPRSEPHVIAAAAATASPGRASMLTVALLLAALEAGTDRYTWRRPTEDHVAYFQQLRSWGYSLSDVEMLVLTPNRPDLDESDAPAEHPDRAADPGGEDSAATDAGGQDTAA
jgi:ParB family transcriptional regulator, chromosome partitioning protein